MWSEPRRGGREELCVLKVTNTFQKVHGSQRDERPEWAPPPLLFVVRQESRAIGVLWEGSGREGKSVMQEREGVGLSLEQGQCLVAEEPGPWLPRPWWWTEEAQSVGSLFCSQRTGSEAVS